MNILFKIVCLTFIALISSRKKRSKPQNIPNKNPNPNPNLNPNPNPNLYIKSQSVNYI